MLMFVKKYREQKNIFNVLLSQKHNRYHYAGEQQTQCYHKKKIKRNANHPKINLQRQMLPEI